MGSIGLVVISGPSGVGKNTLVRMVIERVGGLVLGKSLTTREAREGDEPGKYEHVSREEFKRRAEAGELLEWAEFAGNLYGTLQPDLTVDTILEIDVQGAALVKTAYSEARLVMVMPPGATLDERLSVLRHRLTSRGSDDPTTIERRLEVASREMRLGSAQADLVVVNDNKFRATADIAEFMLTGKVTPQV